MLTVLFQIHLRSYFRSTFIDFVFWCAFSAIKNWFGDKEFFAIVKAFLWVFWSSCSPCLICLSYWIIDKKNMLPTAYSETCSQSRSIHIKFLCAKLRNSENDKSVYSIAFLSFVWTFKGVKIRQSSLLFHKSPSLVSLEIKELIFEEYSSSVYCSTKPLIHLT